MTSYYAAAVILVDVLAPVNGQKNFVFQDLDRSKLCFYSLKADKHFHPAKYGKAANASHSRYPHLSNAFLLPKNVDIPAAAKVTGFINSADMMNPPPVSISLLGDHSTLQEAVELHRVACLDYEFRKSLVSDDIRDFVCQQIYESIPTLASFKLIIDRMAFDKGVVVNMMDRVGSAKIAKTLDPQVYEAIVKYAEKTGWVNGLEEAEMKIREKMAKAKDGRKQAARMGKGKQGGGQEKETRVEPFK